MKKKIETLLAALISAVLMAGMCGCDDEDTKSDITATRFSVDRELASYSSVDNFDWETTLDQPLATVRIKDFVHGDVTMRVFDANGKVVLNMFLNTPNNTLYVGGNDFVVTRKADRGVPGKWRVELGYADVTGHISVIME